MKKQNKQTEKFKKITVVFGYALFALLLIATTVSTIMPMGALVFSPVVRHFNAAVLLVSLVVGAVLPPLISYLIGDRATRSESKLDHHFNGVLFGVASYWVSLFFFFIGSSVISGVRQVFEEPLATAIAGWPILATLIVMVTVAAGYVKSKKKYDSVLDFKPYRTVLFTGLIATPVYILLNHYFVANTPWAVGVLDVIVPVVLTAIAYWAVPSKNYASKQSRVAGAAVAVSIGFIASSFSGYLILGRISMLVPIAVGAVALVGYLLLVRRAK